MKPHQQWFTMVSYKLGVKPLEIHWIDPDTVIGMCACDAQALQLKRDCLKNTCFTVVFSPSPHTSSVSLFFLQHRGLYDVQTSKKKMHTLLYSNC